LSISISIKEMEQIVDDLNANFPGIRKIDFAGCEVLYQKQFIPCLKKLAEHPNADQITLTFHTNFNAKFSPEELSEALKPFGESIIHISVDSGKNIYDYFRTGKWNVLVDNIKKFKNVNNFSTLDVVCTTSAYQIMDIGNVFESLLSLEVDSIVSSIVYTPKYMNPAVMMFDFKKHVLDDFKKTYKIINDIFLQATSLKEIKKIKSARQALNNIENYVINCNNLEYNEYEAFLVYIRKTDKIWKQNFNNHFKNYQFIDNKITRVNNT